MAKLRSLLATLAGLPLAAQTPVPTTPPIPGTHVHRCGTPSLAPSGVGIDNPDCDFFQTNPSSTYAPTVIWRIPVVVHVITATTGTGNLTDTQVQSQITVLNEDFRALTGTAGGNGVDSKIEFYLATTTPNGQPTTGITRSANDTWFADNGSYWTSLAWDTTRYLNIYTLNIGGGQTLGYVPDLPQGGSVLNTSADRVVILWDTFGRPGVGGPPYALGRTTTHEVGHYLGLFHTFEGGCAGGNCYTTGDRICDTAAEANPRFGCPNGAASCSQPDPIHDYMDYTDDSCMTGFTAEQVRRMRCTLLSYRPLLYHLSGPAAAAVTRTGPGNLNSAFSCAPPRLGQNCSAYVVTAGTGFGMAGVYGFANPATVPYGSYTILVDTASPSLLLLPFTSNAFVCSWTFPVPNTPSLGGLAIHAQALLLGSTVALSNAMDLVVGN